MSTMLFVSNLPISATEDSLVIKFARFGTVVSAKLNRDSATGHSKRSGFVEMKTSAEAQIAINGRILDKLSPTEFMLGPGNYVVDITQTGFKPVHKVVNIEKGGKVAIDEVLERQ